MSHVEVRRAIQEAQAEHRERTAVTVEGLTEKLCAAYDVAEKNGQPASMVQAAMGIAKLHGMLVDKVEQTTKAVDDMKPEELTAELARVQVELAAIENPPATENKSPTQH